MREKQQFKYALCQCILHVLQYGLVQSYKEAFERIQEATGIIVSEFLCMYNVLGKKDHEDQINNYVGIFF